MDAVYHHLISLFCFLDRLGRGKENTLFSYIHFESGEGIMICPTEVELSEVHSGLQDQVMSRFIVSCCQIKALFTEQVCSQDSYSHLLLSFFFKLIIINPKLELF